MTAQKALNRDQAREAPIRQTRAHRVQAGCGRAGEGEAGNGDGRFLDAGRERALAMRPAAALGHEQADGAGIAVQDDDHLPARAGGGLGPGRQQAGVERRCDRPVEQSGEVTGRRACGRCGVHTAVIGRTEGKLTDFGDRPSARDGRLERREERTAQNTGVSV
jgi:hypothetical protein